jgi:hypothetical protein
MILYLTTNLILVIGLGLLARFASPQPIEEKEETQ